MMLVFALFVVGVALVALEVVVPSGLLGMCAGAALAGGVVAAFVEFGSVGGSVATGLALLIAALTLYFEFVLLPKTRLARKFSMTETGSGRSQPEVAERDAVLNREALAVTTLAPSGYVEVAGRRYEAFCRSGHAAAGSRMRIVDIDNFRLVVTQIKESS
jgi:membrane-bound ClpP family serine protease